MKKWVTQIFMAAAVCAMLQGHALAEKQTEPSYDRVAPREEMAAVEPVGRYGMLPVYGRDVKDGVYSIEAESSSSMFQITKAELTVEQGEMTAAITLGGQGYLKLFAGTAREAAAAELSDYIGYTEAEDGSYTYEVPVEALDKELDLAAFSKRKEQWYDRRVLFDAGTLPADALLVELPDYDLIEAAVAAYQGAEDSKEAGAAENLEEEDSKETRAAEDLEAEEAAEVRETEETAETPVDPVAVDMEDGEYAIDLDLTGGSGKASVSSPTVFIVRDGKAYVRIVWSSSNYDYMKVGTEKYLNRNTDGGNSTFEIPVEAFDRAVTVIADTTAMGTPHEIEYSLILYAESIGPKSELPQEAAKKVVYIALAIIVGGGIINHILKKRRLSM
ncbi:MAG: hypothetical protein Q4C61_07520 [Lachnospiraceae bacterium]|nr:hypothetical protein [Lachnospiraceae bacterium]